MLSATLINRSNRFDSGRRSQILNVIKGRSDVGTALRFLRDAAGPCQSRLVQAA